jgi:DNA-binding transcriptional LysR family regulator
MIETSWLRAFASFSEDANMSRAARRLHLSQPAVHAQLRRLSEALGVPLYRRSGRGLTLTAEGSEVAAFARELEERTRDLMARLDGAGSEGRVVLAAGAGALLYVIGEALRAFTRQRKARLELLTVDAPAAVEAVRSGLAHVGVGAMSSDPRGLEVRTVTTVGQVLVLRRDHPLARRRLVSLAQLAGERLVLPPEGRPHRSMIENALHARGVSVTLGAVAGGWELAMKLVELGFGLAVVNGSCRTPRGLVTRPLRELPTVRYVAFTRPRPRADAERLLRLLVAEGEAWRGRGTA